MNADKWHKTALLVLLATSAAFAQAQVAATYPSKPIRVIVPWGPGGMTDSFARIFADEMRKDWGQPVLVENRPGASGAIGSEFVARTPADGYTLLLTTNAHTINPAVRKALPFDPLKDFTPLTLLASSPVVLVVRADSSIKTVTDYIAAAKARPGEISYGSSGIGVATHLAAVQFAQITGTRYNHIPYNASHLPIQSLLAGHTNSSWAAVQPVLPFVQDGRLRALAVTSEMRFNLMPDVPTFEETGVKGVRSEAWIAAWAPANLPPSLAGKLNGEFMTILARPEIRKKVLNLGLMTVGTELDKFGAQIAAEVDMYKHLVQAAGIKPEE